MSLVVKSDGRNHLFHMMARITIVLLDALYLIKGNVRLYARESGKIPYAYRTFCEKYKEI